ncbi:MAG: LysM peptidoglycan-binding domain-containing protein [Bacilli bacterium]|nr:LysM peptidoglycan-binding domain-containing protein [Bacilli bacterium]
MDIYIVKENETIEDIAKKFNLTVNEIGRVNDINLYEIKAGDTIYIPFILSNDFIYYEILEGDTLKNIASTLNIDYKTLAYLNGMDIDDYIYPKQVIIVPRENVMVYITKIGDRIKDLEEKFQVPISKIIEDNPDIYLVENQLIIERENT